MTVNSWRLALATLLACLVSTEIGRADEASWKRAERDSRGNLKKMLRAVADGPTIPHWRTNRTAAELTTILQRTGRFRQLGLTAAEGATLVQAAYSKHSRPAAPKVNLNQRAPANEVRIDFPYRAGTEFEDLSRILLRWPFDWSSLRDEYATMIDAYGRGGVRVAVWVDNANQQAAALSYLQGQNVSTSHIDWQIQQTDSVWMRDYGPQFIYSLDSAEWGVVDFHYYDSRPADDRIPGYVADSLGLPLVNRQTLRTVYTEGGNLNHDGLGSVIYSTRTYTKNAAPNSAVDRRILTAFEAEQSLVLPDPSLDATGHVDMYSKLLDETTVLVGEYAPGQVDYDVLETTATIFDNATNGDGQPFNVVRIPQPDVYYVGFVIPVVRTYTNAQLANGVVVVPVYGLSTDAAALEIYETLLPGREIVPLDANGIIESAGAWHCVCMEQPDPNP